MTVVIDHGSGYMKSGFAGWNEPQLVLPSIVNYRPCRENPGPSSARRHVGLGIDILHPDTFSYPVQRGRVLNWEGVEHIWSFVLQKHRLIHEDTSVLVTEPPMKDPMERKKTLEVRPSRGCSPQAAGSSLHLVLGQDWPSGTLLSQSSAPRVFFEILCGPGIRHQRLEGSSSPRERERHSRKNALEGA